MTQKAWTLLVVLTAIASFLAGRGWERISYNNAHPVIATLYEQLDAQNKTIEQKQADIDSLTIKEYKLNMDLLECKMDLFEYQIKASLMTP